MATTTVIFVLVALLLWREAVAFLDRRRLEQRHDTELAARDLAMAAARAQWRDHERELTNRVYHPQAMPTGTRPPRPANVEDVQAARQARVNFAQVGRVAPVAPPRLVNPDGEPFGVPTDPDGIPA